MIKAIFVDFYGTIVHEDGEVIKRITDIIYSTGKAENKGEIDAFWWNDFQQMFLHSEGDTFETQRDLERKSLQHTLERFQCPASADELSDLMFAHWVKPPIFEDAKPFFEKCPLPIYIVSNIDTADITSALEYHGLRPAGVFTSEDARSYKPQKALFEYALSRTGLQPNEVIHIGDSMSSDVKGAGSLGIRAIWLNRFGKEVPEGVESIALLTELFEKEILA